MPTLKYFIVSESHAIDRETEQVSLFNVIEQLYPKRFPCRIIKAVAVSSWGLQPEEVSADFQIKISITRPGKETPDEFFVNFTGEKDVGIIHNLQNLPLEQPGELRLCVAVNSAYAGQYVMNVHPANVSAADGGLFRYSRASTLDAGDSKA